MEVPATATTEPLTGEALEIVRQYLYAGPDSVAVPDPAAVPNPAVGKNDPFTDDSDDCDGNEWDLADMRAANDPWAFGVEL